uniref:Transposase-associated domain-containing protein n=1 Tax=Oryza meridionalis TaxID=40149 RepID=A0A0E0DAA3_9ORYZ
MAIYNFALSTSASDNRILCPCKTCGNRYWLGEHEVREHLICDGFLAGYTSWIHHGESMLNSKPSDASSSHCEEHNDDMDQMLLDGLGMTRSLGKASAGSLSAIKFSNTQVLTTSRHLRRFEMPAKLCHPVVTCIGDTAPTTATFDVIDSSMNKLLSFWLASRRASSQAVKRAAAPGASNRQ